MTTARFTVSGSSKKELESRAIETISSLFGRESGGVTFTLDIKPLVESYGSQVPDVWEAEVEARCAS